MKHLHIFITLCAMIIAQTAHAANVVTTVTESDIEYILYDDNTAAIGVNGGANASGAVVLPGTIQYNETNYTLTTIGEYAFYRCSGLTSVTIPNSVATIGEYAFSGCSLKTVTIGAFVQSIGKEAFASCNKLISITFYSTTPPAMGSDIFSAESFIVYSPDKDSYKDSLSPLIANTLLVKYLDITPIGNYFNAVVDAITLAADKVELTSDEELAIYGYKAAIVSSEDLQSVPLNELAAHRVIAIAGIRQAIPGKGWTDEEQTVMDGKITAINNANSLAAIYTLQKEAFAFIVLHPDKQSALDAIEAARQGVTNSAYLNDIVKEQVAAINSANDTGTINSNKEAAINVLNIALPSYRAAQAEYKAALPGEGTTGNGVRLTKGDKVLELFNLDKVEFFKVSNR